MLRFLTYRLLSIVLVSIFIVFFAFLGMGMIENADNEVGYQFVETVQKAIGQTTTFFAGLTRGDLGTVPTVSGDRPVNDILWVSYKNSIGLLLMALSGAAIIGLFLGIVGGMTRRSWRQYLVLLLTLVGISAPAFLVAAVLQQLGIKYTTTFGQRLVSMGGYAWDFQHLLMPVLVLTVWPLAYITRSTSVSLSRIMGEDYIRTATAKGLSLRRILSGHAFRNLAIPFLTAIGISLRLSLSVLPLVEYIFAWPGIGLRILEAINNRVPLLVATIALTIGLTIQFISLALDFTYRFIDPRLREVR